MGSSWRPYGPTRAQENPRGLRLESQESNTLMIILTPARSGRGYKQCWMTNASSGWPTYSFIVDSSLERLCVSTHKSGVMSGRFIVCGAPFYSECWARRTNSCWKLNHREYTGDMTDHQGMFRIIYPNPDVLAQLNVARNPVYSPNTSPHHTTTPRC